MSVSPDEAAPIEEAQRPLADEIVDALHLFASQSVLRATAPNPDLRVGRVQVAQVLALDLSELVASPVRDRRILHRLRANDQLFTQIRGALVDKVPDCKLTRVDIEDRAVSARQSGGKNVWTEQFLERFAPIALPVKNDVVHDDARIDPNGRLSGLNTSPLHFVRLTDTKLQMFRDGTICFTLRTEFEETAHGGPTGPPADVRSVIRRLSKLDDLAIGNLRRVLADLLRAERFREALTECLSTKDEKFELMDPNDVDRVTIARKAKAHTLIFVERFYADDAIDELYAQPDYRGAENGTAEVPLSTVLASSSLAGILNTAEWFPHYNSRYAAKLAAKDIGYRDDEIYLTDRKATLISAPGFWNGSDSLSRYLFDIILAAEYNVARLAYFSSTLAYYQDHVDVRNLESANPLRALPHVINGRAILALIEESLDLTLLIDHGFTRLFVRRLRKELGFETAIGFIRQRVEDASTSVGLKSSVDAAENTSKSSLVAAVRNNDLQVGISRWAKIAVIVTILVAAAGWTLTLWQGSRTVRLPAGTAVCMPTDKAPSTEGRALVLCSQKPQADEATKP